MLKYGMKQLLKPVRRIGRRILGLPTLEEQQFASLRGCLYTAAQFTRRNYVAGDYLEFGVYEGDSFIKAYHAILGPRRQHFAGSSKHPTHKSKFGNSTAEYELWEQTKPRFFAFDSFAGLPPSSEYQIGEEWVEGSYQCSEDQFKKNLVRDGVDLNDVVIVPG